jgi:AcrR family transcriptional regulator
MSPPERTTKTDVVSDFRRGQILEAARQYFIKHGLADTTVDAIARSAGMAKGTVYLYYKSKDEILRQLLTADLAELHDDTLPAITGDGSLEERLRRFFAAALGFYDRKRDFMDHCQTGMSMDLRKKARQKAGLVFASQAEAWQAVLTGHGLDRATAHATGRAIVSLAYGLSVQRLKGWHADSVEDTVATATSLVLHGVTRS